MLALASHFLLSAWRDGREALLGVDCVLSPDGHLLAKTISQSGATHWIGYEAFHRLKKGMKEQTVLELLGPPEDRTQIDGGTELTYTMRPWKPTKQDRLFVRLVLRAGRVAEIWAVAK